MTPDQRELVRQSLDRLSEEADPVALAVGRDDQEIHRATDHVGGGIAEKFFGSVIPEPHDPIEIHEHHCDGVGVISHSSSPDRCRFGLRFHHG